MWGQPDWTKISEIFLYDEKAPMVFSSGLFMLLFLSFFCIYILLKNRPRAQILYTLLFSIFFYYKSSGAYFWVLILSTLIDYYLGNALHKEQRTGRRKLLLVMSLVSNLGILF